MGREKMKSLLSCFTPEGDFLAILSPDGNIKVWNTVSGNLFGEWRDSYGDSAGCYSCIACTFIRKKRKKEHGEFLLALGTNDGDVLAINIITGGKNWISVGCHPGGTAALSFAKKGRTLHTTGADGMVSELDSRTGELVGKFKASKKCISSLALSNDEKLLAVGSDKIRVFSLENKKELQKFSSDAGPIQNIAVVDGGKAVVSSGLGEKQLQVWECNQENRTGTSMAVLSMRKPPVMLECKSSFEDEGVVVLSVSEAGTAYIWDLRTTPNEGVSPTRILVKSVRTEMDQQKSAKKNRIPVIAARLRDIEKDAQISVIVAYGSPINPQFNILEVTNPGEEVFITAVDETSVPGKAVNPQENGEGNTGMGLHSPEAEAPDPPSQKKREKKKRALSDTDPVSPRNNVDAGHLEIRDGFDIDYDMNEPTMGEKLANLNLVDDATKSPKKEDLSSNVKPPSADSVHVLLKQALHADDHVLLLDCLYTRDEKVIANSISMLNPSDVLKFLNSLVSMIQSRGAVLVCAIPWLRSLLLHHASGIMSQESSLRALNSLYQLIESRVSTFGSALQLSSCLDYLFAGISADVDDEKSTLPPIIYEDKDESDEESESEDAMETDEESEELEPLGYTLDGSDFDGNESMSD